MSQLTIFDSPCDRCKEKIAEWGGYCDRCASDLDAATYEMCSDSGFADYSDAVEKIGRDKADYLLEPYWSQLGHERINEEIDAELKVFSERVGETITNFDYYHGMCCNQEFDLVHIKGLKHLSLNYKQAQRYMQDRY
jgi:hypothetical protein